jgi:hypothetical protein
LKKNELFKFQFKKMMLVRPWDYCPTMGIAALKEIPTMALESPL